MSFEGFVALVDEICDLGYDRPTATQYAAIIGDTPVSDGQGNILVMDFGSGKVLATLKLASFAP